MTCLKPKVLGTRKKRVSDPPSFRGPQRLQSPCSSHMDPPGLSGSSLSEPPLEPPQGFLCSTIPFHRGLQDLLAHSVTMTSAVLCETCLGLFPRIFPCELPSPPLYPPGVVLKRVWLVMDRGRSSGSTLPAVQDAIPDPASVQLL